MKASASTEWPSCWKSWEGERPLDCRLIDFLFRRTAFHRRSIVSSFNSFLVDLNQVINVFTVASLSQFLTLSSLHDACWTLVPKEPDVRVVDFLLSLFSVLQHHQRVCVASESGAQAVPHEGAGPVTHGESLVPFPRTGTRNSLYCSVRMLQFSALRRPWWR